MLGIVCISPEISYIAAGLCSMIIMKCSSPEISYVATDLCSMLRMRCLSPEISNNCCRLMFAAKNGMFIP